MPVYLPQRHYVRLDHTSTGMARRQEDLSGPIHGAKARLYVHNPVALGLPI